MKNAVYRSILAAALGLAMVNCSVKGTTKAFPVVPRSPDAPQTPKPQAPVAAVLKAGDYKPSAGNLKACPQNVGVAKQNQVVVQLYVTLMSPCDGSTILFACENGSVCRGNGAVVTIKSETSYEYNDVDKNWTATFSL